MIPLLSVIKLILTVELEGIISDAFCPNPNYAAREVFRIWTKCE